MGRIVPGVCSLEQHRQMLIEEPERYRPERCPHCGKAGLWAHGVYARKADREGVGAASLNPVAIPRFLCPGCGATCSRLPECVAPRRWYGWAVQQGVLMGLLAGESIRSVAAGVAASRRTVGRWWGWLRERSLRYGFHLRSLEPALGRAGPGVGWWSAALGQAPLSAWMARLDRLGVVVP
jgi:transposase-like protein